MNIIAEIGLAHMGSFSRAKELIVAAKESGATAVKFQIYSASDIWQSDSDIDLRQWKQLPVESYRALFSFAKESGLQVGASLFSDYGLSGLHEMDFLKIAGRSFPGDLVAAAAKWDTDQPVYISCRSFLPSSLRYPQRFVFMACGEYPTAGEGYCFPIEQMKYVRKHTLMRSNGFRLPYGYSSHSPYFDGGVDCAQAKQMGATVIEKHFCLSREGLIVDADHSLEPDEFKKMTEALK